MILATPCRQRGVALLVAILLVALATIVAATVAFNNAMAARRGAAAMTFDQALLYAGAAEALAAYALREDLLASSQRDDISELWAQPYGPLEIQPGVWLEARLEDMQGRFNLNNLVTDEGVVDPIAVEQFQRLLETLEIEPKWAAMFADWIDRNVQPELPDGAEDSLYSVQNPPHRTLNAPVVSVSELLAMPGFDQERFARLQPYVAALPPGTKLNTCTAAGIVLDAMTETKQFGIDPEALARSRAKGCFPTLADFEASLAADDVPKVKGRLQDSSQYFRLRTFVSIGTAEFALYSLMQREPATRLARTVLRTYGTD